MFSSDPKLKTTTRTEPRLGGFRGAFRATPTGVPKNVSTTIPPKPKPQEPSPTSGEWIINFNLSTFCFLTSYTPAPPSTSRKATVEDAEDEDVPVVKKQKKKKKSKKKKTETSGVVLPSESAQSTKPTLAQTATAPTALATSAKPSSMVSSTSSTLPAHMSTISLVSGKEAVTAQSARSYLQNLGLSDKKKVKSRPDHASLFSQQDTEKKGFFSGLSLTKGKDKESSMKEARQSWFSKLSKKTETLMHQLMDTSENNKTGAPMKWESFVKVIGVFFGCSSTAADFFTDHERNGFYVRSQYSWFKCAIWPSEQKWKGLCSLGSRFCIHKAYFVHCN